MIIGENSPAASNPELNRADLIRDGSDATFMKDVVEASMTTPVIVDFWATWCGPCKALTPLLEKAVLAAQGAVKLVKIDIDRNPGIAGQMRIQSVPTVYGFVGGRPVDAFQGALPESQIKAFIDRLAGPKGPSESDQILQVAAEAMQSGDIATAAQAFVSLLQIEPENLKAIAGLARCYLINGERDRAAEILAMAPADARDPDIDSVRAALKLSEGADAETSGLEARIEADPADHEARLQLAEILAGRGQIDEAVDHLIVSMEIDRSWNEEAARKQLLTIIEAAGAGSPEAKRGRRRLSAVLFS